MVFPESKMLCDGWLFLKIMVFRYKQIGQMPGHIHTYDHFTLLLRGGLDVVVNGKTTHFECSDAEPIVPIFIAKGLEHLLIATQDNTVAACVHALHDPKDRNMIFDASMVPEGVPTGTLAGSLTE